MHKIQKFFNNINGTMILGILVLDYRRTSIEFFSSEGVTLKKNP